MGTQTLTSRERLRLALSHQEPDRVPIDVTYTSKPYIDVRKELGLPIQDVRRDVWDVVYPTLDAVEALGCDVFWVGLRGGSGQKKFNFETDDSYTSEYGVTFRKVRRPDGEWQFEMREHPFTEPSMDQIESFPWPDPLDPARYEGVEDYVRQVYETTDFALCARLGGNIWELANYMAGQEKWLMYLPLHPDFCVALMQKAADIQKVLYREGIRRIGKYLSLIRLGGEDFGTQGGLLISPKMFRSMVKPILKDAYLSVKGWLADVGNYDCKLLFHCCGGIEPLIDDFIDMGVDVLDPVQTRAKGMNALHLKETFGDRLSFHGGIDTQGILPFGTEAEVVEETKRKLECFAPGGGYILCPTHNVQGDVSGKNVLAMVRTGQTYGCYPIPQNYDREVLRSLEY
jgi:uroporphyrinogen decarboxylase